MGVSFVDQIPVRMGSPEDFAALSELLGTAQFYEETICRALNLDDMSDVAGVSEETVDKAEIPPELKVLIKLFLCVGLVHSSEVERAFDRTTLDRLMSLGLLGNDEFGSDQYYARTLMYPVGGFWIASDRHSLPDGSEFHPSPDIVFPAIYLGTLRFLRLLPVSPANNALDVAAGTGIGAFVLSRTNRNAVAIDITERATQFALFNRALNKCENVEVMRGDLYEPVAGRLFDRIVTHPPYVPSVGVNTIWRDGGATGELLIRRIVEGLPKHLREDGLFCCLSQGLDTGDAKYEERVRNWLNDSSEEFDVVFACSTENTPEKLLESLCGRGIVPLSAVQELRTEFQRAKIINVLYGALFIRRLKKSARRRPWTIRKKLGDATEGSDLEETFLQHDRFSQPAFDKDMVVSRPRLAPRLELKVTYVVSEGSLVPAQYLFETDKPFPLRVEFDDWMVPLLTRFNGEMTVAEVYHNARSQGEVPDVLRLEDFVLLVAKAMEGGFLILPDATVVVGAATKQE